MRTYLNFNKLFASVIISLTTVLLVGCVDKLEEETGNIISLIVEINKKGFSFSNKDISLEIKWSNIKKIGEDVILVNN